MINLELSYVGPDRLDQSTRALEHCSMVKQLSVQPSCSWCKVAGVHRKYACAQYILQEWMKWKHEKQIKLINGLFIHWERTLIGHLLSQGNKLDLASTSLSATILSPFVTFDHGGHHQAANKWPAQHQQARSRAASWPLDSCFPPRHNPTRKLVVCLIVRMQ